MADAVRYQSWVSVRCWLTRPLVFLMSLRGGQPATNHVGSSALVASTPHRQALPKFDKKNEYPVCNSTKFLYTFCTKTTKTTK